VVVLSAMQGVTDDLIELVHAASRREPVAERLAAIGARHQTAARELLGEGSAAGRFLDEEMARLSVRLSGATEALVPAISGLGEIWSSRLFADHLRARGAEAAWIDARDILVIDEEPLGARVDWLATRKAWETHGGAHARMIVPGFVARTRDRRDVTLGRNGSDYSGAIFGVLLGAAEIHIWTDVDGVLTADPRLVPEAVLIERMSYAEACELAYFGAKVVHPQTMGPAIRSAIPVYIRNTFAPDRPGTAITADGDRRMSVKGVSTFDGLALVDIEGAGMIGVPGTAERAFAALHQAGTSVVMVSQGSSEHTICCVVADRDAERAQAALRTAFTHELAGGQLLDVTIASGITALAVVGDGMVGAPGCASRLFHSLARSGVNIRAIAQGSSERNISVAIDTADAARALRAVHAGFYLSPQTLSVGLIGAGGVGRTFVQQLEAMRAHLLSTRGIDLRLRAVATSRHMALLDPGPASTLSALEALDRSTVPTDLERLTAHVQTDHLPHTVLVDCTASEAMGDRYEAWIRRGIHVVTANKHAGSGAYDRYAAIRAATRPGGSFRYTATVGAGLPIIPTLRDLLDTGDELVSVEGTFSGTLGYIFGHFDGSRPFSELVRAARDQGYTEPDPRDDLSGRDVARKLVILAREAGLRVSLDDVALEGLVPAALRVVTPADFLARLDEIDAEMGGNLARARERGHVLRYVARIDAAGAARVGLTELPDTHPFARSRPTDNVVQFTTRRYRDNPLVVQGPGAGREVTAAGLSADLLRLATSLGAKA
jgi:aspartokinase/homoserine dehydrogenase 1